MLTENSGSGGRKQLADTPFDPVSAIQGLQEVHGKHLFVRGAGVVGQIVMTDYQHRPWTRLSYATTFIEIGSAVQPWLDQIGIVFMIIYNLYSYIDNNSR